MKKEKYEPIPQWFQRNGKIIGILDLFKVETVESDYWVKKIIDKYEVYEPNLKQKLLKCSSMDEAIEYIREITLIHESLTNCIRGA